MEGRDGGRKEVDKTDCKSGVYWGRGGEEVDGRKKVDRRGVRDENRIKRGGEREKGMGEKKEDKRKGE